MSHRQASYVVLLGVSVALTWRLFLLPVPSYWDHVPPPYGWGTLPLGWTDDLLGGVVWVNGAYWLLPFWLLSRAAVAKVLLILPAFVGPLAFLTFARRLGAGPVAGAIGALYYLLNPSVHGRYLQGHTGDILAHALVPIFALGVWSLLNGSAPPRGPTAAGVGLAFFLAGSLKPHWLVLQIGIILPFVVALSIVRSGRRMVGSRTGWLAAGLAFGLLLSLPTVVIATTVGRDILARLHSIVHLKALSSSVLLPNAIRLAGEPSVGWLPGLGYYAFDMRGLLGFLPGLAILTSPFLASGLYRRMAVVTVILSTLTLLLALGTTYSPSAYLWLYEHVPFFTAFRESSKFLTAGTFLAAVGLVLAMHAVFERYHAVLRVAISGAVVGAILVYAWPMFGGDFGISGAGIYEPSAGALEVGRWLDRQPGDFRVMVIPHDDETFHLWPWMSRRPLFGVDHDRALTSLASAYHAYHIAALGREQRDAPFAEMLARSAVRFVVVAERQEVPSSFRFTSPAATLESPAAKRLLESSGRFRRAAAFDDYVVYENNAFRGWAGWVDEDMPDAHTARARLCPPQSIMETGRARIIGDWGEWVDHGEVDAVLSSLWIAGAVYEWVHAGPYVRGEVTDSRWYAITSGAAVMTRSVALAQSGDYQVSVRGLLEHGAEPPDLFINGRRLAPRGGWPVRRFGDVQYGAVRLSAGEHHVQVQGQGGLVAVDKIALIEGPLKPVASGDPSDRSSEVLGGVDPPHASPATIQVRRFVPGLELVYLDNARPSLITFADSPDPRWSVLLRGIRAEIIPCRGPFLHLWTEGGTGLIILWNRTAGMVSAAWLASATAFLLAAAYALRGQIRSRRTLR